MLRGGCVCFLKTSQREYLFEDEQGSSNIDPRAKRIRAGLKSVTGTLASSTTLSLFHPLLLVRPLRQSARHTSHSPSELSLIHSVQTLPQLVQMRDLPSALRSRTIIIIMSGSPTTPQSAVFARRVASDYR